MPFPAPPARLLLASHNDGKRRELAGMLVSLPSALLAPDDFALAAPEETGSDFAANAALKARAALAASGIASLGDDSGLEIAALNGRPGVLSARYAGSPPDFAAACRRLEAELAALGRSSSKARFVCVLALACPSAPVVCFEGIVKGELVFPPRGGQGFGYDPIFRPQGFNLTFGEMPPEQKNRLSHRALAAAALCRHFALAAKSSAHDR